MAERRAAELNVAVQAAKASQEVPTLHELTHAYLTARPDLVPTTRPGKT